MQLEPILNACRRSACVAESDEIVAEPYYVICLLCSDQPYRKMLYGRFAVPFSLQRALQKDVSSPLGKTTLSPDRSLARSPRSPEGHESSSCQIPHSWA